MKPRDHGELSASSLKYEYNIMWSTQAISLQFAHSYCSTSFWESQRFGKKSTHQFWFPSFHSKYGFSFSFSFEQKQILRTTFFAAQIQSFWFVLQTTFVLSMEKIASFALFMFSSWQNAVSLVASFDAAVRVQRNHSPHFEWIMSWLLITFKCRLCVCVMEYSLESAAALASKVNKHLYRRLNCTFFFFRWSVFVETVRGTCRQIKREFTTIFSLCFSFVVARVCSRFHWLIPFILIRAFLCTRNEYFVPLQGICATCHRLHCVTKRARKFQD